MYSWKPCILHEESYSHWKVVRKASPSCGSLQKIVNRSLGRQLMLFPFSKLSLINTWKVFFIPLLALNFLMILARSIWESGNIHILIYNFCSRRWGSSLTICARLNVRSAPHQHERKFSAARVCRVTFKHLPQPLRSHTRSFGILGQLLKIPPFVRPNIA